MISKINGTQINYYFICKTKLWLFSHNIQLEHESESVKLGKILHEDSFKREKGHLIDNLINVDFIKLTDCVEIHEQEASPMCQKQEDSCGCASVFAEQKYDLLPGRRSRASKAGACFGSD